MYSIHINYLNVTVWHGIALKTEGILGIINWASEFPQQSRSYLESLLSQFKAIF